MLAVPVVLAWFLVPQPFVQGLLLGAAGASVVAMLWSLVVRATGTGNAMMGDQGEQWTAQELRSLRSHGWKVVNHVMLRERSDIDHVLVGPGGVYAIETKWSADDWTASKNAERLRTAAQSVEEGARSLRLWLKPEGVTRVEPVVLVWGRASRSLTPIAVAGATVLSARHAKGWKAQLGSDSLSPRQVEVIWEKLDRYCRGRDLAEDERSPLPPAISSVVATFFGCVFAAGLAFFSAANIGKLWGVGWQWVVACVGLVLLGELARRLLPSGRWFAGSWMVGVVLVLIYAGWFWARYTLA